jgi:hypothetical protein
MLGIVAIVAVGCLLSRDQGNLPKVAPSVETVPESALEETTVESDLEDAEFDGETSCTIAFPKPALKPVLSKFRYAVLKKDNDLIETVTQENGVRLVVTQGGCEDFVVIGFEFSAAANGFPKLPEQQLVWVRDRLKEFNCVGYRCEMATWGITLISQHIDKIKKAPASSITNSNLRICHDGTIEAEPAECRDSADRSVNCENSCSWESGGSTLFEVKSDGKGRVTLNLVEARSA